MPFGLTLRTAAALLCAAALIASHAYAYRAGSAREHDRASAELASIRAAAAESALSRSIIAASIRAELADRQQAERANLAVILRPRLERVRYAVSILPPDADCVIPDSLRDGLTELRDAASSADRVSERTH